MIDALRSRVDARQRIIDNYKDGLNDSPLHMLQWYSEQAIVAALWVENGTYAITEIENGNIEHLRRRLRQDVMLMASSVSFSTSTVTNLVERHRLAVCAAILEIIESEVAK